MPFYLPTYLPTIMPCLRKPRNYRTSTHGLALPPTINRRLRKPPPQPALLGVFKIFTTHAAPNYTMPWSKLAQSTSIGTGFSIDRKRRRFITNAHCVEHAVVVQVQKRGDAKKFFAQVDKGFDWP